MMNPADGSLRGTIKSLEKKKLHNLQKHELKRRRGDGCCFHTNIMHLLTTSDIKRIYAKQFKISSRHISGLILVALLEIGLM